MTNDRELLELAAEPVWIQADHLAKAKQAPFLCRVEPTQRLQDFVPLYPRPDLKVAELEAENARLTEICGKLLANKVRLSGENAALRHALQRIADESYDEGCYESPETIARFAIAKESSHDN